MVWRLSGGVAAMKIWHVMMIVGVVVAAAVLGTAQETKSSEPVPKYDPSAEAVFKGTVEEVRDRACPVSGSMGSHIVMKLADGKTIEVHLATTKFVKSYELGFKKGDQVEVTAVKVKLEGVETLFAREIRRGTDTFVFRDQHGKPIW